MKLEYNILWIDNELKDYIDNGSIKDVEEILTEKGFEPNIELVFDEANLDEFIDRAYPDEYLDKIYNNKKNVE